MDLLLDIFYTKIAYASLDSFISSVDEKIINPLITFLFALAVVYFLYGALQFALNPENAEERSTGKSHMMWGIIGITIMMGVWFLMGVVISTLNIKGINPQVSPGKGQVDLPDYTPPAGSNLP